MNTKIIIYDDSCPLCSAYTNAFIHTGLIDKEGRKNFSTVSADLVEKIDLKRAVNEIPVIDTVTSQVWYGIDALLEILQQKIPLIKPIGNIKPVKWMLLKLYKFISYNRRVIVAGSNKPGSFDCTPEFNTRYRVAFLITFLIVNSMLIFPLNKYLVSKDLSHQTTIYELQAAYVMLISIDVLIAAKLKFKNGMEYLGQKTMLTLIIMLLTVPLIFLNQYSTIKQTSINSFYFGILALLTVQEYRRRMKYIEITKQHPVIVLLSAVTATALLIYFFYK